MSRRRRGRGSLDAAIVGMACRFPGAPDLATFAANVLAGADQTGAVPPDRWDPALFDAPTRRGGYMAGPVPFDAGRHGVMPLAAAGGEPEQFLILDAARAALADAGLPDGPADGRRAEVVVARGNYFNRGNLARLSHGRILAQTLAILRSLHPEWTEEQVEAVRADLARDLPPFEAATIPGQLTNATAGRVSDRLDLLGANFVVDAASASSLVALDLAARSLAERRSDLAIVGAVYVEADVDFPLVFRRLGALSRSGRIRPFAAGADGLLSGEGVGVVVLKRRGDAEAAGDRIYAVVEGVGLASDGRGAGLATPSARGHARAIRRAYRSSGIDPGRVALIEGHGLGLPAADRAELRALGAVFPPTRPGRRALGSVSGQIGHAMPAAGMAGLIKAAIALHHRVLPPSTPADDPHPLLRRPGSPVALNPKTRPWVHGATDHPRTAGVDAFGFAGINAHAVLSGHPSSDRADAPGALLDWPTEAFLIAGADRLDLADRAESLSQALADHPDWSPRDLAATLAAAVDPGHPARLGLVAADRADLIARLDAVAPRLRDPQVGAIRDTRGAYFFDGPPDAPPPRMAFLFPGEGSQYAGMLGDLAPHFPEVRALLDTSDRLARAGRSPEDDAATPWPSEVVYGPEDDAGRGLWAAGLAVNVVLSGQWALYQVLTRLGLRPDAVLGHSSGEFLALAAGGAILVDRAFEDGLGALGDLFGRLEATGDLPQARLVALATHRDRVEGAIRAADRAGVVVVAMDNCPHQVVVAGPPRDVATVVDRLRAEGVPAEDLPFDRAYHTPAFAPALGPIRAFFDRIEVRPPTIPVVSCATAEAMPDDPAAIRDLAVAQWTRRVAFRPAIEGLHRSGVGVFVDVGARGNLAGFVEDTLRGRPSLAVAANLPRRSGLTQLNHLVASLFARGVRLDPGHLYARRRPTRLDLAAPPTPSRPVPELKLGFPTMQLSAGMLARLRPCEDQAAEKETFPSLPDEPIRPPTPSDDQQTSPLPMSATGDPSEPSCSHPGGNGVGASPCLAGPLGMGAVRFLSARGGEERPIARSLALPLDEGEWDGIGSLGPTVGPEEGSTPADDPAAVLLDFQRTMNDFLATQETVMASFLGGAEGGMAEANGHAAWTPAEDEGFDFHRNGAAPGPPGDAGPWAGDLASFDPGRSAVAVLRIDAAGDPVAEHHTLGGRRISAARPDWRGLPVLPFSVMAEMLAEHAARLAPEGWTLVELREVRAHRWIRYEEDGPATLELRAEVADPGADPDRVVVRGAILNRGPAGRGRPGEAPVFDGRAVFAPAPLAPEAVATPPLAEPRACRFTAESVYAEQWLFHGPALRAVAAIGPIGPGGIDGTLRILPRGPLLRDPGAAGRLRTDPIALDNFTHLLGAWGLDELADRGDVIFPLRMEALTLLGPPPPDGTPIACRVRVAHAERHRVRAEADLVRPDGTAWMTIRGWEDWRFHWPGRYRDGFRHPDRSFLGEPLPLAGLDPAGAAAVWLEPPGDMGRPVWRDVLEHVQLGPDERAALLAGPMTERERTDRLWGRIAAKEAARRVDRARGLAPTYPADLLVGTDQAGRPALVDRRDPDRRDLPRLAVAGVEGVAALALAARHPDARPGIAAVAIGHPDSRLEAEAPIGRSSPDEIEDAEGPARLEAARRAGAQALGVDPAGVAVVGPGREACAVGVPGGRAVRVTTGRRGDFAWAWTIGVEADG